MSNAGSERGATTRERGATRHFLVTKSYGKLARIVVFDDVDEAVRAYGREEQMCGGIHDCVLLGADRLSSCIATHGNWFDEPNRLLDELLYDEDQRGLRTRHVEPPTGEPPRGLPPRSEPKPLPRAGRRYWL